MTKDEIYGQCKKVSGGLTWEASRAYYLACDCSSARFWWRKDPNNMSKKLEYGQAATELEKYCREHGSIRPEIDAAFRKIDKIHSEAKKQKGAKSTYAIEAERLNRELATIKNGKDKKFFKIMRIIMIACIVTAVLAFVANIFLHDMTIWMFGSECLMGFVVSIIIMIVKSVSNKKKREQLEKSIRINEKIDRDIEDDRLDQIFFEKEIYRLVISALSGASVCDYR